ncbi:hypothetical protein PT274_01515 [Leuconostocaceae bacterium ESL0958]|nr:hypothetical protein [Leuconostocaceae bacterium ESL0958]
MDFDAANSFLQDMQHTAGMRTLGDPYRVDYSCLEVHEILNEFEHIIDELEKTYAWQKKAIEDQPVLNEREIKFLEEHDIVLHLASFYKWYGVSFEKVVMAYVIGYKKQEEEE